MTTKYATETGTLGQSTLPNEQWRAVDGYDERCRASSLGRIATTNYKNGMGKLTEVYVRDIKRRHKPYEVMAKDLAKEYGVSTAAVKDLLRGRTWRHVQ